MTSGWTAVEDGKAELGREVWMTISEHPNIPSWVWGGLRKSYGWMYYDESEESEDDTELVTLPRKFKVLAWQYIERPAPYEAKENL
jgi:hypothetical protein